MPITTPDVDAIESDVDNVTEARCKLEDLLNDIVDKTDGSKTNVEEDLEQNRESGQVHHFTPTKKNFPVRTNRKRKKKDYFYDEPELSNKPSYVVKMFDRRVNLANFNKDTSLYTMLRDWMKNKPLISKRSMEEDPEEMEKSEPENSRDNELPKEEPIYSLPGPVKSEEMYPRPLPPALKTALLEDIINTKEDLESLKKDNMFRWRKVRSRWKEHSKKNQQRHLEAIMVLNTMTLNPAKPPTTSS